MAARYPPEFRRRAVELARLREKPITHIAEDLGISDATLHGWLKQADIDEGSAEGLTTDERAELVQLRRANRVLSMEIEILKRAAAFFARENVLQDEIPAGPGACRVGSARRGGLPGAARLAVGVLRVAGPCTVPRAVADAALSAQIIEIYAMSRGTYGVPWCTPSCGSGATSTADASASRGSCGSRVHGIVRRRGKRHRPAPAVHDDLVRRRFIADAPDRLWLTDIT